MKITLSRKEHFNAAHRLFRADWTDEKNKEIFGKCSNINYHGHNYEIIVKVTGNIDPLTGYVMDVKTLSTIIKDQVTEKFDHKNLNLDCAEFTALNPTAENICVVIWQLLRTHLPTTLDLHVTLFETERNSVEYDGKE